MIRPILTEIGLFLTPFVLYARVSCDHARERAAAQSWRCRGSPALLVVSLVLMVGSFLVLAQFSGAPPGSTYVPAHIENGKFVPGTTR